MSLFITSLNSGSNGNCYYVGNSTEAILVDAGISCKEIEKRMNRLGLKMEIVKAIFVSHEHTDHIKGIPALAKKHNIPVYITTATMLNGRLMLDQQVVRSFTAHEPVLVGKLSITAFPKKHDACDPYSFVVNYNNINVGVFTDIGIACKQVIQYLKLCNAVFLESNYDEDMLTNGSYPYHLKRRITGGKGHLSNKQAYELLLNHKPSHLTHLILSHLSHNNNCPKLVQQLFSPFESAVKVVVASRLQETEVYQVTATGGAEVKYKKVVSAPQLSFAFA